MLHLDNVTLVCIDGGYNEKWSYKVLEHCIKLVKFNSVKFFCHFAFDDKEYKNDIIEKKFIPKFFLTEHYSQFVISQLYQHIETTHVLIVQYDGFILNPEAWNSDFLNFDYLGAPWPKCELLKTVSGNLTRVGNGGFSLRSKKLLEVTTLYAHNLNRKHEDVFVCVDLNDILTNHHGCIFPSLELAQTFSWEYAIPNNACSPIPFGFHRIVQPSFDKIIENIYGHKHVPIPSRPRKIRVN